MALDFPEAAVALAPRERLVTDAHVGIGHVFVTVIVITGQQDIGAHKNCSRRDESERTT